MECLNFLQPAVLSACSSDSESSGLLCDARLGPCELQDPLWVKMSTAVSGGVNKKRKKTDTKSQQSQINKRDNEKRRRMQENTYIEELALLISATFADMNRRPMSSKPDKTEILQKTVDQIRTIRQQEGTTSDAVQQGEVSSSKPTILPNDVFGPLLLEALEGFLFVVNTEGKVEYVTENVSQFIKYTKDDVLGESIYNIIHHGDHARFDSLLVPITIGSIGWTTEPPVQSRNRSFNCRLLVKPPDDQDETMEEKQQRVSKYETMQISSTLLPYQSDKSEGGDVTSESAEVGPCLMCVARRIEKPVQQFTMKLDINGKIIGVDTSNVSPPYSHYLNKDLVGRIVQELCHQQEDLTKMAVHLKETLHNGHSTSAPYRLRLTTPDKYVQVQTKSKLFKANATHSNEPDFIMATHSIIDDSDMITPAECGHLTPTALTSPRSLLPGGASSGTSGGTSSVGGPLMSGPVNGQAPQTVTRGRNGSVTSSNFVPTTEAPSFSSELSLNDLSDLFPHSTWDLGEPAPATPTWERPPSRPSLPPTPRPPSLPSPGPALHMFPFSPPAEPPANFMEDSGKDSKDGIVESVNGDSAPVDSGRLRNLLTKRPSSSGEEGVEGMDHGDGDSKYRHPILKELLDQEDDDEHRGEEQASPASRGMIGVRLNPPESSKVSAGNNNMLLKLLNKSDDDDVPGIKKQDELFQQLLTKPDESKPHMDTGQQQEDPLLKSFGLTVSSPPGSEVLTVSSLIGGRKRPSDEGDECGPSKRPSEPSTMHHMPQVSSSQTGNSKLCEKNKMLASLLAKKPSQTTTIPPLPPSVISATPQLTLERLKNNPGSRQPSLQVPPSTTANVVRQQQRHQPQPRLFLNQLGNDQQQQQQQQQQQAGLLHMQKLQQQLLQQQQQQQQHHQQQQQQRSHMTLETALSQASGGGDSPGVWDNQFDPFLSDILDEVIDFVHDADPSANINSMQPMDPASTGGSFQVDMNEKMAINAITKALMSCESVVKSPTPPAYTSPQGFPPPPLYQQRPRFTPRGGGAPQYNLQGGGHALTNPQLIMQQRSKLQQLQQIQKERLLQQQQQQQMLIPSNARDDQLTPNMQNMESLLNNTVAPNVSLQRSASVPDSQLSPNYAQISPGQRLAQQPYSPQGFSPGFAGGQQNQARLSPGLPPFQQSQLSPRITAQGQQGYGPQSAGQPQQGTGSWSQAAARLSIQQQQNPMLNAQLTGSYSSGSTARAFATQRQQQQQQQQQLPSVRSLASPGGGGPRQSPYPPEQFAPPASPTQAGYPSQQQFQQQQLRLQRTISAPPGATTQLPGGLTSPRHYSLKQPDTIHPMSPHHPYHPHHPHHHHHPMMYHTPQPNGQQFCFDQASLQLYGASERGHRPHPQHTPGGGGNNETTREYVRQELRAIVGARTQQQGQGGRQLQLGQQVSPVDLEALGLSYEPAGASDSPKLWGNIGGAGSPQPGLSSRNTMEESSRPGDQKSSLLQKLLSE